MNDENGVSSKGLTLTATDIQSKFDFFIDYDNLKFKYCIAGQNPEAKTYFTFLNDYTGKIPRTNLRA